MVSRRRKQNKTRVRPTGPLEVTGKAPKNTSEIPTALTSLVEEAVDLARLELNDTGRITPKAVFVYDDQSLASGAKSVVVALSSRSDLQKDAVRKRINEKALQEGARAVLVIYHESPGVLTVLGMTAEVRTSASVTYSFNAKTKTVSRWEMH